MYIHVLMRDERRKKERSKQGQTNNKDIHVLMRDERRKKERSKQGQTNNKEKQHSTSKVVTFPKKNELPHMGQV